MGRKKPTAPTDALPATEIAQSDQPSLIDAMAVAEATGGMDMDAYCAAIYAGIDAAYGDANVYVVARVLDEHVAELLETIKQHEGRTAAYETAIRFAETILPYAKLPTTEGKAYRALRIREE